MSFFELHFMGGVEFMAPLSLLGFFILFWAGYQAYFLFRSREANEKRKAQINLIVYFGSFALFWGILGHTVAIYSALQAIEKMGEVSPAMLAGGLKISLIVPMYGLVIFLISSIVWFVLRQRYYQAR